MEDNNNQNKQLQLNIKPEVASGQYSNLVLITHSHTDFILDFARHLPGMPQPDVCSRIIMAPEHAKRLLMALQDNVQKYEKQFGTIRLTQPQQQNEARTIAPFTIKQGEA